MSSRLAAMQLEGRAWDGVAVWVSCSPNGPIQCEGRVTTLAETSISPVIEELRLEAMVTLNSNRQHTALFLSWTRVREGELRSGHLARSRRPAAQGQAFYWLVRVMSLLGEQCKASLLAAYIPNDKQLRLTTYISSKVTTRSRVMAATSGE